MKRIHIDPILMTFACGLVLLILAPLVPVPTHAQSVVSMPTVFTQSVQTVPGTIPTSSTCIVGFASTCTYKIVRTSTSTDPYICTGDLAASGQTIVIQDANSVAFINGALGTAGSTTTSPLPMGGSGDSYCRMMPGGVYWNQSGGTTATGRLTIKFNP